MNHQTMEALEQQNNPSLMQTGWDDRKLKKWAKIFYKKNQEQWESWRGTNTYKGKITDVLCGKKERGTKETNKYPPMMLYKIVQVQLSQNNDPELGMQEWLFISVCLHKDAYKW